MSLIPAGRRRIMVAQNYDSPFMQENQGFSGIDVPENINVDHLKENDELYRGGDYIADIPEKNDPSDPDLVNHIFEFMSKELGYPPRRLNEFRSQFVNEEGGKGEPTQYTITLPDQVYGKNSRIPGKKLKELVRSIESEFGYSYERYKRSDLKITLEFVHFDNPEDNPDIKEENETSLDILDEVYGSPSGNKKAFTINELIKESKDSLINHIRNANRR